MSFLRTPSGISHGLLQSNALIGGFSQVRTATKRVSGSKTNKNDSAGRRLGPKVFENNFVNPGEIIMRQRGTKIHPGENTAIGRDHTIFAMEPGYVRFYLDPFHPLRKFVGVALKKDIKLPVNHFDPRIRRFGYEEILDEAEAKKEEDHMSRKEYLAQPELKEMAEKRAAEESEWTAKLLQQVQQEFPDIAQPEKAARRLFQIGSLIKTGQTLEEARDQVTFNELFELQLAFRRNDISQEELDSKIEEYKRFASELNTALAMDHKAQIHKPYSETEVKSKRQEILARLESEFTNIVLKDDHKATINSLLNTPGIFSHEEIVEYRHKFIPKILPESVPGTVLDIPKGQKLPPNAVVVRTFNPFTKSYRRVVRTKDAFN